MTKANAGGQLHTPIFAAVQLFLYNIFLFLYKTGIRIAALFNDKAKLWVNGRRDLLQKIKTTLPHDERRIWMHCASLGEFEQGRPLLEAIRKEFSQYKIVLTFFSPSGYEAAKNFQGADYIFYLPMDGRKRSSRFIRAINPSLAIFIKYEFWYYYICNLERSSIPLVLVSGVFRKEQPFFKWYGGLFRSMLKKFSFFFVQDDHSKSLLSQAGFPDKVAVTGDTRYDRVFEIARAARSFPLIEQWKGNAKLLIAGSTWKDDEQLLRECMYILPEDWKLIIAPHEVDAPHIAQIVDLFSADSITYSSLSHTPDAQSRVLIIDNIGMLSSLFRYGAIAYIGGGFQKGGIHNTLEPAVFGLPVIFGPVYEKFVEAVLLAKQEFAYPVNDREACTAVLSSLISNHALLRDKQQSISAFVAKHVGATTKIMVFLNEHYLEQPPHSEN